jgi:hypothetical protein
MMVVYGFASGRRASELEKAPIFLCCVGDNYRYIILAAARTYGGPYNEHNATIPCGIISQRPTRMQDKSFFDVNVEEDCALIDDFVLIDKVIAVRNAARSGQPDPHHHASGIFISRHRV